MMPFPCEKYAVAWFIRSFVPCFLLRHTRPL
jgi:hypothetical protein